MRKDKPRDRDMDESVYSGRASSRMERQRVTPGEQTGSLKCMAMLELVDT
jgi:hypothetical protein